MIANFTIAAVYC